MSESPHSVNMDTVNTGQRQTETESLEQDDSRYPDFTELPDVAWLRIMHYLPLQDRFRVSETCRRLNAAFNHPSLWSSYNLQFWGDTHNFSRRRVQKAKMTYVQANIVKRFGKYFQHLIFIVHGHLRDMAQDTIAAISEITRECRLDSLTIHAGALTSRFHTDYGYPPKDSVLAALVSFVKNAYRMKHLHIRSWPMFETLDSPDCNIFIAITQNPKLTENLESLTLFGLENEQWSEREPLLLSAPVTCDIVEAFKNLTTLGLRSPMISEKLLKVLTDADRARIDTLQLAVHYVPNSRLDFKVPHIRSSVWQALVSRNPKFRVECSVLLNVPELELANLLTPEVPVSVFKVLQYAKLDPLTLVKLHTHYSKTLRKFICYCDSYCLDEDLMKLVTRSVLLDEFVYHGQINASTVISAAKTKGDKWEKFQVKRANVKIEDEYADVDEDEVLSRGPDGELVLVGLMRFHQPEERRQETLEHMTAEVSRALGVPWTPV